MTAQGWRKRQIMQWVPSEKKEQPEQEPVTDDISEKIRVRIMQEAYDLADRNDSEGYNSVKVMCSDVLALLPRREWIGLTEEDKESFWMADQMTQKEWDELFAAIEAKLREKNGG